LNPTIGSSTPAIFDTVKFLLKNGAIATEVQGSRDSWTNLPSDPLFCFQLGMMVIPLGVVYVQLSGDLLKVGSSGFRFSLSEDPALLIAFQDGAHSCLASSVTSMH